MIVWKYYGPLNCGVHYCGETCTKAPHVIAEAVELDVRPSVFNRYGTAPVGTKAGDKLWSEDRRDSETASADDAELAALAKCGFPSDRFPVVG